MMLYRKFLQIYIVVSKSIIVKYLRWFLMIQLLSRHKYFDGQVHAISVLCFKGMVTVMLWRCQSAIVIQVFSNHQALGYCMWCEPKSYNRGYVLNNVTIFVSIHN